MAEIIMFSSQSADSNANYLPDFFPDLLELPVEDLLDLSRPAHPIYSQLLRAGYSQDQLERARCFVAGAAHIRQHDDFCKKIRRLHND